MLIDKYKAALGKSTGRQSLYDHSLACVDVALRVARLAGEERGSRLDRLILATFLHDIGKLDPAFQAMLEATASGRPFPGKKVRHEASTFHNDHISLVEENKEVIRQELRGACGYELDLKHVAGEAMDHVWAFAVTHHGLFYVSYERDTIGVLRPHVRRQWTSFYPNEDRRITLVDLLFGYHPLGGLVIISDLLASYCHERGEDYRTFLTHASSLGEVFAYLTECADEIEAGFKRYDPRSCGIKETLKLVAGGIR